MKAIHNRGDRMKSYEDTSRLPGKAYTILRVDGRAFHTLTRGCEKPFDPGFIEAMDAVAIALCSDIQGAQYAYTQSDEISVLLTDFGSMQEPWFGGVTQKMASVAAAIATEDWAKSWGRGQFDARVFTVPSRDEAINYMLWRQADCHRNAISMIAEANFSSKKLHGLSVPKRLDLLGEAGIEVESYPAGARLGRVTIRETFEGPVTYTRRDTGEELTEICTRTRWVTLDAPWFDWDQAGFLEANTPSAPVLSVSADSNTTHDDGAN